MLKQKYPDNKWSYSGYLSKENQVKVAVLLPDLSISDDEDRQHTIVGLLKQNIFFGYLKSILHLCLSSAISFLKISFRSSHVGRCTHFRVKSSGVTECMEIKDPHSDHDGDDTDMTSQIIAASKTAENAKGKEMDRNGYK